MSSLIVLLPSRGSADYAQAELAYALVSDTGMLTNQGFSLAHLLPKASAVILQVPPQELSWRQVDLPRPGRSLPPAKLRAVLENLLEDHVLSDTAQLHFALPATAAGGEKTWVAICDKNWLAGWKRLFESLGRTVHRIVPLMEPQMDSQVHVSGTPENARLFVANTDGVLQMPLAQWRVALPEIPEDVVISAEPAVAALAEHTLQHKVQLLQGAQWMSNALGSSWNIGQFDLATDSATRWKQKVFSALRSFAFAPQWRAARLGLALLLTAELIGLNVWAWQERTLLKQKRALLSKTVQQITGASYVSDQPSLQLQQMARRLQQQTGALGTGDFEVLLSLAANALPQPIPPGISVNFSPGELLVQGMVLSPDQLQQLRERGAAKGYTIRQTDNVLHIQAGTGALNAVQPAASTANPSALPGVQVSTSVRN